MGTLSSDIAAVAMVDGFVPNAASSLGLFNFHQILFRIWFVFLKKYWPNPSFFAYFRPFLKTMTNIAQNFTVKVYLNGVVGL